MNEVKRELELLKSWGFETVSIDKVLEMIEKQKMLKLSLQRRAS